jgi:hypothetical protein
MISISYFVCAGSKSTNNRNKIDAKKTIDLQDSFWSYYFIRDQIHPWDITKESQNLS